MTNKRNLLILVFSFSLCISCGQTPNKPANTSKIEPTPAPTVSLPVDRNYDAKGKVTKIDMKLGTVEIDHGEIVGLMPAMLMEFNVRDKTQLSGIKVGDTVEFVIEYKDRNETIVSIKKPE